MSIRIAGRLRVLIAANQIAVVREHGLVRAFRVECAARELQRDIASAASDGWSGAVEGLEALLAERGWTGLPMDVAVSSEFIHLAIMPGLASGMAGPQLHALAQASFERVLGDMAADWEIRHCALDRTTLLAAAMDRGLAGALGGLALRCQSSLKSITPLWSCMVNQHRSWLSRASSWIMFAETGAVVIALLEGGVWKSMRRRPVQVQDPADLARTLEREQRLSGSTIREVVLDGPAAESCSLGADWIIRSLPEGPRRLGALPAACRWAALAGA